jgi:hypothetical protein
MTEVRDDDRLREERSLGQLFSELSQDTATLIREEINLAKAELSQKANKAGRNIAFLAVGGFVAYAGFLFLLAALTWGLAEFMALWLAALIVGAIVAIIGYVLVQKAINTLRKIDPVPEQTVETLKEDREWLKDQVR